MSIIDSIQLSGSSYDVRDKSATTVVSLTQQGYDALPSSAKTDTSKMYVITDAEAGDLTNYYTKTETDNAITAATATKQDTLVSGTNIKTINNISILGSGNIDVQGGGGGKAIEAGRGISITTGATADTVSFSLPISAGTGINSVVEGASNNRASGDFSHAEGSGTSAMTNCSHAEGLNTTTNGYFSHAEGANTAANGDYSHAEGNDTRANGIESHAEGYTTVAKGAYSHAEGYKTSATSISSHAEGAYNSTSNSCEHASGRYNITTSASTTFGDSGNTLFSVGNGTDDNARHNAFEIRQNGDIYLSSGGTDIKLQDHLGSGGGGGVNVVQTTGTSTTDVMSQDAVTTVINTVSGAIPSTYVSAIVADTDVGYERFYRFSTPSNFNYFLLNNAKINNRAILSTSWGGFDTNFSLVETSAITTAITSSSTDAQVPSAKAVNDKLGGLSLVKLTQAEYDALATKDNSTLYVIVN